MRFLKQIPSFKNLGHQVLIEYMLEMDVEAEMSHKESRVTTMNT